MSEASGVSVPAALLQHLSKLPLETLLAGREQTVLTLEHSNTIGEALRVRPDPQQPPLQQRTDCPHHGQRCELTPDTSPLPLPTRCCLARAAACPQALARRKVLSAPLVVAPALEDLSQEEVVQGPCLLVRSGGHCALLQAGMGWGAGSSLPP